MTAMWDGRLLVFLLLSFTASACRKHEPLPPGAVVFENAGVALVPGDDWQQLKTGPLTEHHDICLPVLEGQGKLRGTVIQVYTSPGGRTDPEQRAASVHHGVERLTQYVADSFQQEDFTTESGLRGIHLSYELKIEVQETRKKLRNHLYLIQNAQARTIGISFTALPSRDFEPIHQMIRKTLRLE